MQFNYKEKDYAEHLEKKGFVSKHRQSELNILAAYWYSEKGIKGTKLKEKITEFCKKYDINFRPTRDYGMISKALKQAAKRALVQIDSVPVYKEELQWIEDVPLGRVFQKALFVILIQKRLENMVRLGNEEGLIQPLVPVLSTNTKKFKDMIKAGGFPAKTNFDKDIIFELSQRGLVTPLYGGKVALDYFKSLPQNVTMVHEIEEFDEVGAVYDYWLGDRKAMKCACGAIFWKKSNRHKQCAKCRERLQKEMEASYNRKRAGKREEKRE